MMPSGWCRLVRKSKPSYMLNRSATTTTSNVTSHVHVRHPCEAVAQVLASSSQKRFVSCSNNMKVMRRVGPTTVAAATLTSKRRETAVDSAPRTRRTTSTRDWGGSAVAVCAAAAAVTTALSMPSANEEENSRSSTFAGMVTAMASTGMRSLAEPRKKGTKKENEKKQSKATTEEKEKDEHEEEILFEDQCLLRQLHKPIVPYPAWDYNWDNNMIVGQTDLDAFKKRAVQPTSKKTRHLLLIRHGQYDETYPEDSKRKLTELGIEQAKYTGQRIRQLFEGGFHDDNDDVVDHSAVPMSQRGRCHIKAIHTSDMARAKETADIIQSYLPTSIPRTEPDPLLNEALPSPMIPIRPDIPNASQEIDNNHDRIEQVFHKYVYRDMASAPAKRDGGGGGGGGDSETATTDDVTDEFEIIVGHGNVIRYMFCRALQLPPEAWLRLSILNCSITYIVIRPNGIVGARMLGDIGHIPYNRSTFSNCYGYKW